MARLRRKKRIKLDKEMVKKSVSKILVVLILIGLNWAGISAVVRTFAYFNDTENSGGIFTAGGLDFHLTSPSDFSPGAIAPGESAERTISFLNNENIPKYKVKPVNFSGTLCDYLTLQVKLDGVDVGYNGLLIDFDYGPVVFETPEGWTFILTLPVDAPELVQGQICNFNFLFYGSQTENNLPFGGGFNDTEEDISNIASKICQYGETRTMGYWKNHESVYSRYLPQTLGTTIIASIQNVDTIFDNANADVMRDMLKAQLLAMKFNIAHFGIGEYVPAGTTNTLNQIVAEADDLLLEVLEPPRAVLEAMKTLLDNLNNLHEIQICSLAPLTLSLFTTNGVVLNEFLPNPEGVAYGYDFGNDDSMIPQGEWVELYNNSDVSYDLSGWYIWDASGDDSNKVFIVDSNTQSGNTIISGKNWLVVYMNKEVLDNTGDTVKLFDNTGTLIDFYTYTGDDNYCEVEPTPGDENITDTVGDCCIVPPNKSYARIPDGTGGWVDPIPTPGWPNILSVEETEGLVLESEETIIELNQTELEQGGSTEELISDVVSEQVLIIEEQPINEETTTTEDTTTTEEIIINEATTTDATTTDLNQEAITEEVVTDEVTTETSGQTTEDVIEEVIEELADEPIIDEIEEEIIEEISEEIPIIEEPIVEEPIVEEVPIDEVPVIEPVESPSDVQTSEEQPVTVPDQSPPVQEEAVESPSDSGDTGIIISE